MYTIYVDGRLLYDPRIADTALKSPTLELEANKHGSLSFTIHPTHAEYGNIQKLLSTLSVYRDGQLVYQGRPTYSNRAFRKGIEYKCEEMTARMNDFLLRPGTYTMTVHDFISAMLTGYNQRDAYTFPFMIGDVISHAASEITYECKDYIGYWDAMQEAVVKQLGGYLVPRYEYGAVSIEYHSDETLPSAQQQIVFGKNMTDLFIETDTDETFSILVPTGADIETEDEQGNITKTPLTIESVNGGKDYIVNVVGFDVCGMREMHKRWETIDDAQTLLETAREYLYNEAVRFSESVELSAVDLHNANVNVEAFWLLVWVTAVSSVHNLSARYVLKRIKIPLGSPNSSDISLGDTSRTLTDRIVGDAATAKSTAAVNSVSISELQGSTDEIKSSVQTLQTIFGTDENAILRVGKITRNGQQIDALILKSNYALQVEGIDVGKALTP